MKYWAADQSEPNEVAGRAYGAYNRRKDRACTPNEINRPGTVGNALVWRRRGQAVDRLKGVLLPGT